MPLAQISSPQSADYYILRWPMHSIFFFYFANWCNDLFVFVFVLPVFVEWKENKSNGKNMTLIMRLWLLREKRWILGGGGNLNAVEVQDDGNLCLLLIVCWIFYIFFFVGEELCVVNDWISLEALGCVCTVRFEHLSGNYFHKRLRRIYCNGNLVLYQTEIIVSNTVSWWDNIIIVSGLRYLIRMMAL